MSSLADKRILILGGAGFIGTRLSEILIQKHSVKPTIAVRTLSKCARLAKFPLSFVQLDLESDTQKLNDLCQNHDVVIDLSFAGPGSMKERVALAELMAQNVIAACQQDQKIIHLGSISSYGNVQSNRLDENSDHVSLTDSYSASKRASEKVFLDSPQTASRSIVIQPTIVYGPWSGWSMGSLNLSKTSTLVFPEQHEDGICNAVYIDDVCQAIIRSVDAQAELCGQTYLISGLSEKLKWMDFHQGHFLPQNDESFSYVLKSQDQIDHYLSTQQKQLKPWSRFSKRIKTDAEFRAELLGVTGLSYPVNLLRNKSSATRWDTIKDRIGVVPGVEENAVSAESYPDKLKLELLLTPFQVDISKASNALGYQPQFSFEKGIEITRQWAKWFGI